LLWALWWGPTKTDECFRRCDEIRRQTTSKRLEATAMIIGGSQKAASGALDEGRADATAGRGIFGELGDEIWWAGGAMVLGTIELNAGAYERAYELLSDAHTTLAQYHGTGYLATIVGYQAQAALELGRLDEALELADETERLAQRDDFEPHARVRLVRARVSARRGDFEVADELIREATEIVERTDYAILQFDVALAQADVERLAGRRDGERSALEHALELAEAKGNVLAAERARSALSAG
jgi:tetratricopeptide (TPR) repeat protein